MNETIKKQPVSVFETTYGTIYQQDCLEGLKAIKSGSIDLIMTDPPYLIRDTHAGGNTRLARTIQPVNDALRDNGLVNGLDPAVLPEMVRVLKTINLYIWCNKAQIPEYLTYFVGKLGCSFDILVWVKTNSPPTFHNKYLSDKEYCLYFRKGGYCQPTSYETAKTAYFQPTNVVDKKSYAHPTIKPLNIMKTIICNSSKPGDIVLDPFLGSGTTAVACAELGRQYIGYEINGEYFEVAQRRIQDTIERLEM
ncbi:DNA-methyltransferase [Dysgonomonas gadei]|uniref:DNA-methyltransferase n=1 Tax=Dysgonomonas gadei TaxID=156974 RepID=UPI003AEF4790